MKEEIVSPSTGVPYCIEKCMKCNNSETKGQIYRISFAPVDLIVNHDYRSIPYIIPEGLRRLYEQGMHQFLDKLKEISRLQRIPELSSVLPDFHDIFFNEDTSFISRIFLVKLLL